MQDPALANLLDQHIRTIPDYPKPGIAFRDITTLLKEGEMFATCIDTLKQRYQSLHIEKIAGIEARGFILGAALAYALNVGFVPIRKQGKLPAKTLRQTYELEYGSDCVEAHVDAVAKNERVVLIDDLIATGGTAIASTQLLTELGAEIVECAFLVNLSSLGGQEKLKSAGYEVFCLCDLKD